MNKNELIEAISNKVGSNKKTTTDIINAFQSIVTEAAAQGDEVAMTGFGTFKVRQRESRVGRNPQTGVEIDIPASKVMKFSAGKSLKEAMNPTGSVKRTITTTANKKVATGGKR